MRPEAHKLYKGRAPEVLSSPKQHAISSSSKDRFRPCHWRVSSLISSEITSQRVSPAIGYGVIGLGGLGSGPLGSDEERFKALDRVVELGCTNTENACIYGDSGELLSKWFARTPGSREEIFLATRSGLELDYTPHSDPAFVREQIAQSLKRL